MTKQEAIKKYNLQRKPQDEFETSYNIKTWQSITETEEIKRIYELSDEFSKVTQDKVPTLFLTITTIYKNKLIKINNSDSYRRKTIQRIYTIKGE